MHRLWQGAVTAICIPCWLYATKVAHSYMHAMRRRLRQDATCGYSTATSMHATLDAATAVLLLEGTLYVVNVSSTSCELVSVWH